MRIPSLSGYRSWPNPSPVLATAGVLISLDTTRAALLAPWGNPWIRTPNLDALAAESIVLEDYMTAAPLPSRFGPRDPEAMASRLRSLGYVR